MSLAALDTYHINEYCNRASLSVEMMFYRKKQFTMDHLVREEELVYKYEATFILNPAPEISEQGIAFLKNEFQNSGISILKEENKGELELSYPIKKNKKGRFIYFELEAPSQSLNALEKVLQIKSEILKFLFIRI
jgi:small subunit ribosomal protein S6